MAYEYSKFAEFYADFKSVEIIEKKSTEKKEFAKRFCKLVVKKRRTSDFSHFFGDPYYVLYTALLSQTESPDRTSPTCVV